LTVVVGVAAYDGIILAADSRSTWFQPEGVRARVISDNAIKLFTVGNCAIATYGTAIIGPQSIAGLIDEFVAQLDDTSIDAETLARELGDFFADRFNSAYPDFDADNGWALGFLVAGYNGDGVGRLYEVLVPTREVTEHVSTQTLGGSHGASTTSLTESSTASTGIVFWLMESPRRCRNGSVNCGST
jgi:hypothetical protein